MSLFCYPVAPIGAIIFYPVCPVVGLRVSEAGATSAEHFCKRTERCSWQMIAELRGRALAACQTLRHAIDVFIDQSELGRTYSIRGYKG